MSASRTNQFNNKYSSIVWRLLTYYYKTCIEFFRTTDIHGLKYLTFNYLTKWEKLLFLGYLIIAVYFLFYFTLQIMEKWQTSPMLTVFNPKPSLIRSDPFPAITICNMNQIQYSKVKDFDRNSSDYVMLQKICSNELNYTSYAHIEKTSGNDNSLQNFLLKNSQPCSDMVVSCTYGNEKRTCTDLFREIPLVSGLCCTFNSAHPYLMHKRDSSFIKDYTYVDDLTMPVDWNPAKGYPKDLPISYYPRRPAGYGISNGLSIVLNGDLENYYCSSSNGAGFKMSIHNPIEIGNVEETGVYLNMGVETSFRLILGKEEAVESLKTSIDPKKRQCYFIDEYPLLFFRYYTRNNCVMECNAKSLLRKCNCTMYYMPNVKNDTRHCNFEKLNCVTEIENDFKDKTWLTCLESCMPSCNQISYLTKMFYIPLNNDGLIIRNSFLRNISKENLKNYNVVNIYFPNYYYRGFLKNPSMSITEFLSELGGILSLMMGFSIMSYVEIIYFFFIKPFLQCCRIVFNCRINRHQEHHNQTTHHRVGPMNPFATSQMTPNKKNFEQLEYVH